jgi:SAM-dependent methyltransferase
MNRMMQNPYDAAAPYSDFVYERCFGRQREVINQQLVRLIDGLLQRGSHILEVGAGTGRLTIPLARAGHRVTAIDQSKGMVEELKSKVEACPSEVAGEIVIHHERIENFLQGSARLRYDLMVCVYAVLNHLLKVENIEQFCERAFKRLKLRRYLLLGLTTQPVARHQTFSFNDLHREIALEPLGELRYRRIDHCEGTPLGESFKYLESLEVCVWDDAVIMGNLRRVGFHEWNAGADALARMDAKCLLFRKLSRRDEEKMYESEMLKEVY